MSNKHFSTRCIHAGQEPDPTTGAIMTPVYQTSTFVQTSPGEFIDNFDYSRSANPTRTALEANLASLEGGRHGISFASGSASLAACIHLLSAGDHVLLCDDVYGGPFRMFNNVFERLGIQFTRVDMTNAALTRAAFTDKTKLVWLETPTNPMLKVVDIAMVTALAREKGAISVVDNTFATPYLQNPLALGADIVSHSCTKYIGESGRFINDCRAIRCIGDARASNFGDLAVEGTVDLVDDLIRRVAGCQLNRGEATQTTDLRDRDRLVFCKAIGKIKTPKQRRLLSCLRHVEGIVAIKRLGGGTDKFDI